MMRLAGFDAFGAEMSPWLCQFARDTFNVPMLCGPIEDLEVEPGSFDMLIMMDVLEHMPDPVGSMKRIANLLNDEGLVVIQTPCLRDYKRNYEQLKAAKEMFLEHMKEKEHLYLYNEDSATKLLKHTGFPSIAFEKPIFAHDMFIFAGKRELSTNDTQTVVTRLTENQEGRTVLALIDLYNLMHEINATTQSCKKNVLQLQAENKDLRESLSWKVTKPLRFIGNFFK